MQKIKNKTMTISIAIVLIISMGTSMMLLPTTTAHTPPYQIKTYALVTALPSTVGVSQQVLIYAFLGNPPIPGSAITNNYRFHNYQVIVTAPDGKQTTKLFDTISDTTGSQVYYFVPDQIGTYNVTFNFLGMTIRSGLDQPASTSSTSAINDTYLPSSASTSFTVQQDAITNYPDSYPLPAEFWTRPIYGENPYWYSISSNWLGTGSPANSAVSSGTITGIGTQSAVQRYPGDAVGSLTSHIMWTKPLQTGGIVGGNNFPIQGDSYFEGSAYSQRYTNPIIVNGHLYYNPPENFLGSNSGPTTCVDLVTGQVIWQRTDVPAINFAYIYDLQDPNQHGVWPALLCTTNFARVFDADTGDQLFNVTGVPTGTIVQGPQGEQLRYVISNTSATNWNWSLAEWNSTKLFQGTGFHPNENGNSPSMFNQSSVIPNGDYGNSVSSMVPGQTNTISINGSIFNSTSIHDRFDWNVSIGSWRNTMTSTPTVVAAIYNDYMICRNGTYPSLTGATNPDGSIVNANYTYFKVDINPASSTFGQALWWHTISVPNDRTITYGGLDPTVGVFVEGIKETRNFNLYSTDDGHLIKTTDSQTALDYFGNPIYPYVASQLAYGKLYSYCYGGILYCYDLTTGSLLWTYGNGGTGNSTDSGFQAPGNYPGFIQAVGNGVVYIVVTEHTIETPIYKGAFTRGINATDGAQIWTLSDYTGEFGAVSYAIADGYTNFFNGYDNQIYTLGQGPTTLTVSAPDLSAASGQPVVIQGTVTDVSAGTKQTEQAGRFPNGVPCAADSIMSDWMGYIYQQKPLPTNFVGVDVAVNVLDSNNNFRNIGTATTDATGAFNLVWKPDIPGKYTVIATFEGTNGYWPSSATTAFDVMDPIVTPAPQPQTALPPLETYIFAGVAAIIIAIAIVGAVTLLTIRKRP
jgi:hypothetical protein